MSKRKLGHNANSHVDEEDEEDEIQSTPNRPNKQQKVNSAHKPNGRSIPNSAADDELLEEEEEIGESDNESDTGSSSGESGEQVDDESEEECDSDNETERVRQEQLARSGITEPEAGIIETIELENFMCHKHFMIKLNSNVNFIAGENGSGKSAVLIALIVCLGAKAGFTNRGHKLSDLIKSETNTATITVRLRNRGPEAYKPDRYGNSIIIERKISRNSTSSYRVKDHQGKTVSNKYNDVSMILEQFNIQIDNPMSILTQDTSRQFLNSAGPQDKYKQFLAATQLDKMTKDYDTIDDHILKIGDILGQKEVVIEELDKKVKEYQKEYKDLEHVVDLERQISVFKNQLAWCFVAEAERETKRKEKQIKDAEKTQGSIDNEIKKCDEIIASNEQSITNVQEEIREFTDQNNQFEQKMGENQIAITRVEMEEQIVNNRIDSIKREKAKAVQRYKRQQNFINDAKAKNAQLENNAGKQQEIDKKKQQIVELEARRNQLAMEKVDIQREKEETRALLNTQRSETNGKNKEIERKRQDLTTLRNSSKDITSAYGNRCSELLQKIEANKRQFQRMPIGPIGLSLKIKEEKWACAIESAVSKQILKNFLVFSIDDGNTLQKIAKSIGLTVEYARIPETKELYRTPDHDQIDQSIPTVLRVLDSQSHYIINFLIDSKRVESIGLAMDRGDADEILFDGRVQRGLNQVFDVKGNNYGKTNSGNKSYKSAPRGFEATMLRVNSEGAINRIQRELDLMIPEFQAAKKKETDLDNLYRTLDRKISTSDADQSKIDRRILEIKNDIKNLEDTLIQQQDDTTDLEAALLEIEEEIRAFAESIDRESGSLREIAAKKEPYGRENRDFENQIGILKNQLNKIEASLRKFNDERRKWGLKKNALVTQKGKDTQERETLAKEYALLQEQLKTKIDKASQICERVEVPEKETNTTLTNKIIQFTKQIARESKGKRSRQEALKAFTESNNSLRETTQQRDNIHEVAQILRDNLNARYKKWQRFRLSIARRSNAFFNIFLSRKGYAGSLTFDHNAMKLDINVDLQKALPSNQNGPGSKGDTKGLSGGERSFSTVSLLLAFWENMECPFRAMDEFDVFMDEVNRSISINLLLSKAEENRSKQYIFVTPLALNSIHTSDHVSVHRVSAPVRGQNTRVVTGSV